MMQQFYNVGFKLLKLLFIENSLQTFFLGGPYLNFFFNGTAHFLNERESAENRALDGSTSLG